MRRAADLAPSVAAYRSNLSQVLLGAGRTDEAKQIAQRILARETRPEIRSRASEVLSRVYEQ